MTPDIDIKRILTSALEAALEEQRPQPPQGGHGDDHGHRGLKALAIGAAPFAAGAALVTAARAGRKHLPLPARMALSKFVKVPNVGDMAETARDRVEEGADALRHSFTDHDDAEARDDAEAPADSHGDDSDDDNDLADEILADAHEESDESDDQPQNEQQRDERSDEPENDRDERSDDPKNDRDERSDETDNDDHPQREQPDLMLEMNRGSGEETPDLFDALSARHPRPPVMQALNRRTKQTAKRG